MRDGLPFSKPRVRLHGDAGEAQAYLGEAYNLLFKVRQFCEASGTPVFSMSRSLPDGAVVTAAIVGGEEIVSCSPPPVDRQDVRRPRKKPIVEKITTFYAVPSSLTHQSGYTPQHPDAPDASYPGPSSIWVQYDKDEVPPEPAPIDPQSDASELTPSYTLEQHPGSLTWFSDQILEGGKPIVVSWRGPSCRYGRPSQTPNLYVQPTSIHLHNVESYEVVTGRQYDASARRYENKLWVNGRPYTTPVPVWSAAMRLEESAPGTFVMNVYVMSRNELYKGPISRTKKTPSSQPTELTLELVGVFELPDTSKGDAPDKFELWQAPFFNGLCTEVALLFDTYVFNSDNQLFRTVLARGRVPSLDIVEERVGDATSAFGESVTTNVVASEYDNTVLRSESEWLWSQTSPIAGDFVGAELVYLEQRMEQVWAGSSSAANVVVNQPNSTFNSTITGTSDKRVVRILHSKHGEIRVFERASGAVSRNESCFGGVLSLGGNFETDFGYSDFSTGEVRGFICGGDLRFDSYLVGATFRKEIDAVDTRGSWPAYSSLEGVMGGGAYKVIFRTEEIRPCPYIVDRSTEVEYALFIQNVEVSHISAFAFRYRLEQIVDSRPFSRVFSMSSVTGENTITSPAYEISSPYYTGSSTPYRQANLADPLDYLAKIVNDGVNNNPVRAAHFAFSPDGKYGYVGWQAQNLRNDEDEIIPQVGYEAFVIEGEIFEIEPETFAPGDASTLAGPVFFGTVVERNEADED